MGNMVTKLGPSGQGLAGDKHRGYDVVSSDAGALANSEWQKVDGHFAANTAKTIAYIYAVHDCIVPTIQVNGGNTAAISVKVFACNDRLPQDGADQDETKDLRAAHWVEITGNYLKFTSTGSAALASTAAAISSIMLGPTDIVSHGFRPTYIKITFAVDNAQGADAIDVFSHATAS